MKTIKLIVLLSFSFASSCSWDALTSPTKWFEDDEAFIRELQDVQNKVSVKKIWSYSLDGDFDDYYNAVHPFISDALIFIADDTGSVASLSSETGKVNWKVKIGLTPFSGLTADNRHVYLGTYQETVTALDVQNGKIAWQVIIPGEVMSVSEPSSDTLIVRTNDNKLLALDTNNGDVLWQSTHATPALTLRGASRPIVFESRVYAGYDDGKLSAYNLQNGFLIWEARIMAPFGRSDIDRLIDIDGHIVVSENFVYAVSYQGNLAAIDITTGRIIWSRELSSYTGLAVDDAQIYVSDDEGGVWAFDKTSGASVWKQEDLMRRQPSRPTVVGANIVVSDYEGYLHWINTLDGSFVGRNKIGNQLQSPLESKFNRLYTYDKDSKFTVFESDFN